MTQRKHRGNGVTDYRKHKINNALQRKAINPGHSFGILTGALWLYMESNCAFWKKWQDRVQSQRPKISS